VRELSTKDVVEAYGLRLVLEAVIAQEAAKHITDKQLAGLEDMLQEMKKHQTLNEIPNARRLSREFHSMIADTSRNDLLIKLYGVVSNAFPDWLLYEALFRNPELLADSMSKTHQEHVAIVQALRERNAHEAVQWSIAHVMESGKWLEEYQGIPGELLREKEEQVSPLMK
jgi:DNA-binding GntR family transcriptional regulator